MIPASVEPVQVAILVCDTCWAVKLRVWEDADGLIVSVRFLQILQNQQGVGQVLYQY